MKLDSNSCVQERYLTEKAETAQSLLKNVFGYETFRSLQKEIIDHLLQKKDALVVMPTGGGKSLCYQIPSLLFKGLTIVVSPLISLMKNQVDQLQECGVAACYLNSSLSPQDYRKQVARIKSNKVKLLYLSPESLLNSRTLALLSPLQIDCWAIDEAHCISEWGHDFRPEYRRLAEVRTVFPNAACIALTATATPRVREDIKRSLHIADANEFIGSFNRPNLFIEVSPKTAPVEQIMELLNQHRNESGIIYCFSRRKTEDLCKALNKEGYSAGPYHAGLTEEERTSNQDLFIRDEVQIIVATIAFGMGINKPDVRFVIHHDLPRSMETYYQEIGRAGRDGLPSHCLLLFGYQDIHNIRYFIQQKSGQEQVLANVLLNTLLGFCETDLCRRIPLLSYFGDKGDRGNCGMCDNCREDQKDLADITVPAQMFLSCVKRTGERFGAGHIIDVLRGSKSQKVLKFEHEKLSTYGIGQEYSAGQWRNLSRQFIQKRLIFQELEHGTLQLTPKAWDILQGKEAFMGRLETVKAVSKKPEPDQGQYDPVLFELLRKKRKEIADRAGLPPFTIFHDRTLREMTSAFPQSREALSDIFGIGAAKLDRYGDVMLEILRDFCKTHRISEQPRLSTQATPVPDELPHGQKRYLHTGERFNSGMSVEQLATYFGIKRVTVLDHLYQYVHDGNSPNRDEFLPLSRLTPENQQAVFAGFDHLGTERLRPVYDALNQRISYEELKLLRLSFLCRHPAKTEFKTLVCLAASRKYGGYCLAGKEYINGKPGPWIRPIGTGNTGELSVEELRLNNGAIPKLLDIVTIKVDGAALHLYQKENVRLKGMRPCTLSRRLSFESLPSFLDQVDQLWEKGHHGFNGLNDRVPIDDAIKSKDGSLLFIKPEKLALVVEDDYDGRKKVRARFKHNGTSYRLAITDPDVERAYLMREKGDYPVKGQELYLTISLGEPFEGYCYKLVAGIVMPIDADS